MDTVIVIGNVATAIIAIISCVVIFIKPVRTGIVNFIKKTSNTSEYDKNILELKELLQKHVEQDEQKINIMNLQGEALLSLSRNEITHIYYKYLPTEQMPAYEKENLVRLYTVYHNLNGNSYVTVIFEEMKEWDVTMS